MAGNLLIILGISILTASLFPVRRLIVLLPTSTLRNYWYALLVLIAMFMVGYVAYGLSFWQHHLQSDLRDLLVPAIFVFGSSFVWITCTLFLRTTIDLRRMALLEEESITDPLIGIYNRRYLERRLTHEIVRARRYDLPLSILMIDIDHFKTVNDIHGHQAGDLALNYIGKLILDGTRQVDIAARYGGEEIVVIATDTAESAAAKLAERLRENIAAHELILTNDAGERKTIRLTISIGVARMDEHITTLKQLIEHSDKALYQAKEEGRNRVKVYKETSGNNSSE